MKTPIMMLVRMMKIDIEGEPVALLKDVIPVSLPLL